MQFGLATVASTEKARGAAKHVHMSHMPRSGRPLPGCCYCDAARPTAVAMMPKMTIAIATFPHDHSRLPLTFLSLVSRAIRCLSQWSTISVTCSTVHRRGASVGVACALQCACSAHAMRVQCACSAVRVQCACLRVAQREVALLLQ